MSKKFKQDWWRRKEENAFSFYDQSKKLFDWDSGRTGYSSYFVKDNQNLRSAAKMIGSMFSVMNVPKNVKYESYITNSKAAEIKIPVPLAMLRDEKGNYMNHDTKLLDAFYGACIQNAAIATMQTKFDCARTFNSRCTNNNITMRDFMFSLLNIERIDKKLAERFPGYSKFVQKYKQYKYDETYQPLDPNEHAGKRLAETIAKFIRYPAHISEEEIEEFSKPLSQIETYMKKYGFPVTSGDCDRYAKYLSNIIEKFIKKQDEQKSSSDGDNDSDGNDDDEENLSNSDSDENDTSAPDTSTSSDSLSKSDMNELAKQLMKSMVNAADDSSSSDFDNDFEDFIGDVDDVNNFNYSKLSHENDGEVVAGNVIFKKSDSNKDRYMNDLTKINSTKAQVLAKLFERKAKDYQFSMKSMRSGRLDTNKLAEAKQMVPTIYERFGQVKTNKLNVGVLIDESGSMGWGDKMQKARQAAIFVNEVLKKQKDVQLFIYGHTADEAYFNSCDIMIYKEPGVNTDSYALGSCRSRRNNRDGDAILAVAKRIRSKTSDPGLLFVISDGSPNAAGYDGQKAIEDTRKKVTMAQALGFQVIQIAIEEDVPCNEMFDYYIRMTNIESLPNDLIGYVSKKVDKLIKEKTII
jgi:hypothetical protein